MTVLGLLVFWALHTEHVRLSFVHGGRDATYTAQRLRCHQLETLELDSLGLKPMLIKLVTFGINQFIFVSEFELTNFLSLKRIKPQRSQEKVVIILVYGVHRKSRQV